MDDAYRLLLDESMEHELLDRLDNAGHDVEHIQFDRMLGKGAPDRSIARRSIETDRFVVTYDDHFVTRIDEQDYRATLFVENATMSVGQIARAIDNMAAMYPPDEVRGLVKVGRNGSDMVDGPGASSLHLEIESRSLPQPAHYRPPRRHRLRGAHVVRSDSLDGS